MVLRARCTAVAWNRGATMKKKLATRGHPVRLPRVRFHELAHLAGRVVERAEELHQALRGAVARGARTDVLLHMRVYLELEGVLRLLEEAEAVAEADEGKGHLHGR